MDPQLLHPYALIRRGLAASASALNLHGPRQSIFDDWESPRPSMESNYDSETEFVTVAVPPFDKRDIPTVRGYPYVKHGSGITLLLSGHKAGTSLPIYQSGSLISGMVVLSKPASIASLEVKVRDLQLPSLLCHFEPCQPDSPSAIVGRLHLCSRNSRRWQEWHRLLLGPTDHMASRRR